MGQPVRSTVGKRDARGVVRHGGEWLTLWADPLSVAAPAERLAARRERGEREARMRAIGATLRAIAHAPAAGEPAAQPASVDAADLPAARGEADSAGLRLRHHDAALHARLSPVEAQARQVFDVLEAARWQALGVARMPGCLENLAAAMDRRLDRLGLRAAHLAAQVPLAEALPSLALQSLLALDMPLLDSGAMRTWRQFACHRFGAALDALRPHVGDQARYAAAAHDAIAAMFTAMQWDDAAPAVHPRPVAGPSPGAVAPTDARDGMPLEDAGRGTRAHPAMAVVAPRPYHAFTQAFDEVVDAAALVSDVDRRRLREKLDRSMREAGAGLARLAHRLQRQLQAERLSTWQFDSEEGLLDAARLARIVADPTRPLSFKQERLAAARDTAVILLIDNSGSMRGRPVALAAMAADFAAAALERCGVACEVLGFTTNGWNGGRGLRAWAAAGRPADPGRLCDLRHVVYKSAAMPYRRARDNFGVMLGDDLLCENVDGEALLWAAARLHARPERRRLLLVISDGAPNDRSTLDANRDVLYLARHLRAVVAAIEAQRRIELSAIGIRHDVGGTYRRAVTVDDAAALGPALLAQLGRSLRR